MREQRHDEIPLKLLHRDQNVDRPKTVSALWAKPRTIAVITAQECRDEAGLRLRCPMISPI